MAGTAVSKLVEHHEDSAVEAMRETINLLVDDIETLRAALDAVCDLLDADAGVSGTNYASTAAVATAATVDAYKVNKLQ